MHLHVLRHMKNQREVGGNLYIDIEREATLIVYEKYQKSKTLKLVW